MTPEQKARFRDTGYLFLPHAVSEESVSPVKGHILHELKKQKIWSDRRTLSSRMKGMPAFKQITWLGQAIQIPSLKDRIMSRSLLAAVHELAGMRLATDQRAQLLLSLPEQGEWTLQDLNWHRDISAEDRDQSPGIQAFVLIDNVSPTGGATLALAGSHRIARYRSVAHDTGRVMKVDGERLTVVEMSGRAGDAYLMDMRLIHAPSINATRRVRMMATMRYFVL